MMEESNTIKRRLAAIRMTVAAFCDVHQSTKYHCSPLVPRGTELSSWESELVEETDRNSWIFSMRILIRASDASLKTLMEVSPRCAQA